tara:strand:- start:169 stop:783 length:615 start_codon:yes stop_codon:yes gene_type:complete
MISLLFIEFDWNTALIRFTVNTVFIALMILIISKQMVLRRFSFSFLMISLIVFFLCFTLKNFDLNLGMALGLFAIFGIIRYRTQPLQTEEMTYLFITIGMAVINALSDEFLSLSELIIINLTVILFIIFGEFILMKFSYNKVHPLAEDINRRIVLQLGYTEGDIKKIIENEIKKQEKNLNINVKTFKVFKIDKHLNIITIHVYY